MCGIVGYIGENVEDCLINNLKKLEYRGYDSSGIAVVKNNEIIVTKEEGKISNLETKVKSTNATCGIAHTRWATHGKPTKENAHPHMDKSNNWALVHNGIIENYLELKNQYKLECKSETDSEVIVQLLGRNPDLDNMSNLINVCSQLKGSFALACINRRENKLYLAKNKSPLYIAVNFPSVMVASDPICFVGFSSNYYALEDKEFAKVDENSAEFFNQKNEKIKKKKIAMQLIEDQVGKQEYNHFMLKEIMEVPYVLNRVVESYNSLDLIKKLTHETMQHTNKILIIGCGTAYHVALMASRYIEKLARIDCKACVASEFRYSNPILDKNTTCIFVSQSGETADTLAACDLAKQRGSKTVALTNVLYSTLAKKVEVVLPVCAGPEIAVASTKAYTAQIAIMYMLAKELQNFKQNTNHNYITSLRNLANTIKMPTYEDVREVVNLIKDKEKVFFIGRDLDYITCEEASLKLKEISYINSSAHPAGELKHGFLALVDENTILFSLATQNSLIEKTMNACHEAMARGGKTVKISQLNQDFGTYKKFKLQQYEEELMPIVSIGYFQVLSYYTCLEKGFNPDQPRNLAKSVTVE